MLQRRHLVEEHHVTSRLQTARGIRTPLTEIIPVKFACILCEFLCRAGRSSSNHPRKQRSLCYYWGWAVSNYTIIAADFASRYCASRGASANTRPNSKTDTRLVGFQYNDSHILNIARNTSRVWPNHPKLYDLYHMTGVRPPSWCAIYVF